MDDLRDMRILVVDDMPTNIILIRAILEHGGFSNILTAEDGSKALRHLEENSKAGDCAIDLVLLDIIMPSKDGFSVCRAMQTREEWQRIPTIMITSENKWREEAAHASFENGATDIMFKPVRSVELIPRVTSALTQKRERDMRLHHEQLLQHQLHEYQIAEARLKYLVNHDDLTGMFNRRRLEQVLEQAIMSARYQGKDSALLYIDIDHFKIINNCEGHSTGDQLLIDFSLLLREHFGARAVIARIGADNFAILLENTSQQQAMQVGQAYLERCSRYDFIYNDRFYPLTASIGLSVIANDIACPASHILAQADQACYAAKLNGRNTLHLYTPSDHEVLLHQQDSQCLQHIRAALLKNNFTVLFQPILNTQTQQVEHHEALLRLQDGENLIGPAAFIPVAERRGLIHEIDRWVIRHIIEKLATCPRRERPCISINLSVHAFHDHSLLGLIESLLEETGVAGEKLIFEITETAVIEEYEQSRSMVLRLHELGCRFSIDNFGTGFNSYHYLKHFPVDYLKINGTFIHNLQQDTTNQALVRSMIDIGHTLGMQVVAEHVENRDLATMLGDYGIDYLQGHYVGQPTGELPSLTVV
ncbi:EAL domain-containing protein [Sulfuriflexus mobilis]|uniref:two-component system response regulator n=1 Tax=Sulfuriflexus mobilis TaxID=1811807 RepID=UPI0015586EC4|nr:EAL domain-containing protein [Sulfuriflexus mobilis]